MTEKQFKSTKFQFGDKVKIGKEIHLIYNIDFEFCLFGVFDKDAKSGSSYVKNYHCSSIKFEPKVLA